MRILITGSRTWTDRDTIRKALLDTAERCTDSEPITLIHGTATGADSIAAQLALGFGWLIEAHPADWLRYGKRAGFIRNVEMVATNPDICLAFIHNDSRGASMCADLASKAGVPLNVWASRS